MKALFFILSCVALWALAEIILDEIKSIRPNPNRRRK